MKSGIELITEERQEQIHKHGFSLELDKKYYQKKELKHAAEYCLMLADYKQYKGNNIFWPQSWDKRFEYKIINKTVVGKLTVAGALLMAENERRGDNIHRSLIEEIAAEIDRLHCVITVKSEQS